MPPLPVLPAETYARFDACVHCGLCLPACPTYLETADEADSPRGRIHLMKAVVNQSIPPSQSVFEHLDRCLICRACETACPSGVVYHELIEAVRPQVAASVLGENHHLRSTTLQWFIKTILPFPKRAALAMLPLTLAKKIGLANFAKRAAKILPAPLGIMADTPSFPPAKTEPANFTPAKGEHRGSVILLRGCVGSVVSSAVNAASVKVLSHNGYDVHLLPDEPCCGAIAAHANDPTSAHDWAAKLVDLLTEKSGTAAPGCDRLTALERPSIDAEHEQNSPPLQPFFISPIAGCGAQLKSLDHVLAFSPIHHQKAQAIVRRMRDITEFLHEVGLRLPENLPTQPPKTVTYHDPCHLLHAQKISDPPRQLLAKIPNLTLLPLPESDLCCGAAGTYNLSQPEMAHRLGQRKTHNILNTAATELITANIGCALQISRHLQLAGKNLPVRHVIELLADLYDDN